MSLRDYPRSFDVLEVQSTFYRLPMLKTAERWRSVVPKTFDFTIKAFQGIRHPISIPTWKRARKQRPTKNVKKLKVTVRNTEADCVYVMFNNIHMKDDAVGFAKLVRIH